MQKMNKLFKIMKNYIHTINLNELSLIDEQYFKSLVYFIILKNNLNRKTHKIYENLNYSIVYFNIFIFSIGN